MNALSVRFGFLVPLFSGWVNRRQLSVIESLLEENRLLREQLEGRRLRLTDDQRRRLAVKGQVLGRRVRGEVAGIVTPDTILRDSGIEPAPQRGKRASWGTFLAAHWDALAATVLTLGGLVRYFVFFVIQ